jgi:hypothetical protein
MVDRSHANDGVLPDGNVESKEGHPKINKG